MARSNLPSASVHTHEGAVAHRGSAEDQLRRSVMSCLLWETEFYEDGIAIADRILGLIPAVGGPAVVRIAHEARDRMRLRHVPLLLAAGLAKHGLGTHARDVLAHCIQRADELSESIAVYARVNGRDLAHVKPLAKGVAKGIADAFPKFDEYQLAKYDRAGQIRLRDALFLSHAEPENDEQAALWKRLVAGELSAPDTWEVGLSAGEGAKTVEEKRARWERLLDDQKLGAMALFRNLRNLVDASVPREKVSAAIASAHVEKMLPFRFIAAAKHAPSFEPEIESALFRKLSKADIRFPGLTVVVVDCSASMRAPLSGKSQMYRSDAAAGVAMILREVGEDVRVVAFGAEAREVPARRGFALRDAITSANVGHSTFMSRGVSLAKTFNPKRIIVIGDEQSHDQVPQPECHGYIVNVASAQYGVSHGSWIGINGWSEAVLDYIHAAENLNPPQVAEDGPAQGTG